MKIKGDRGSVIIDFVFFGVFLQLGLLLLATQIIGIQSNQLAAESIARHCLRSFLISGTDPMVTANQILQGFESEEKADVEIKCDDNCELEGTRISVSVKVGLAQASLTAIR